MTSRREQVPTKVVRRSTRARRNEQQSRILLALGNMQHLLAEFGTTWQVTSDGVVRPYPPKCQKELRLFLAAVTQLERPAIRAFHFCGSPAFRRHDWYAE